MPYHDEGFGDTEFDPKNNPHDRKVVERYGGKKATEQLKSNKQGSFPSAKDWAKMFIPQADDPKHVKVGKTITLITAAAAGAHSFWPTAATPAAATPAAATPPASTPPAAITPTPITPASTPSASPGEVFGPPAPAEVPTDETDWGKAVSDFAKENWKEISDTVLDAGNWIYDQLTTSPKEELEQEFHASRTERLLDLRRHARGDFSQSERAAIMKAYEPVYRRVLRNLATRGISGAAEAQILAQAEQAPFLMAQQHAIAQLDTYELESFKLLYEMTEDDPNFFDMTQQLIQKWGKIDGMTGGQDTELATLNQEITRLTHAVTEYEALVKELKGDQDNGS